MPTTAPTATDWDAYYTQVPVTARLTRKYSTANLLYAIERFVQPASGARPDIVEIGGANSCFVDAILARIHPASYHVFDTNRYGLTLLEKRYPANSVVHLHQESVLALAPRPAADLVYSVGLVEHFAPAETRQAIHAHFDLLRPGGIALITFPTPTLLYRLTRGLIETLGMWKFHDERPLRFPEVRSAIQERGVILYEKILWPLMLTQGLIVARKN